jgi:tetratricopeptide (TPR) repeat protein
MDDRKKPLKHMAPHEKISYFTEMIEVNAYDARAWYERGHWRGVVGEHEDAIADLDEALRLNPDFAWAHYERGLVREAMGNLAEAQADLEQAIGLRAAHTSGWRFHLALGRVALRRGRRDRARDALDYVLRIRPNDGEARHLWDELRRQEH